MVALVSAETVLLVLLALLVAGLLRSHAEILRRLEAETPARDQLPEAPARDESAPAPDVAGPTLEGNAVQIGMRAGTGTLLAFMTSGCATCKGFWESFGERPALPGGARLVIVCKDGSYESPTKLRELAPRGVPVVLSTAAWEAYGVPVTPYFVYVDGASGLVHGEGAAEAWPQVASLLTDALADAEGAGARGGEGRARRAEDELELAGIGPGHPSLYEEPADPAP
ncbi:MAG: hypothetical protein E6G67_03525 [Actinobacteria bacterium]|nr:MAG: hypothetical protein E6G67_03525 [Actinomycetota bacterium]